MATAISRPYFGPLENNFIVCAKKTSTYPVDQPINIDSDCLLIFFQNGEDVGGIRVWAKDKTFILNKKNVIKYPNRGKKLSTGLFSKEYKNVTIFWYFGFEETIHLADTLKTKSGYSGRYDFNLHISCSTFLHDNFSKLLHATNIKTDQDKIIISKQVVREIIAERVKGAMATILDASSVHSFDGAQKRYPPDIKTLEGYLESELSKLGLQGTCHVQA